MITLKQGFSTSILPPKGTWQFLNTYFVATTERGGCSWHLSTSLLQPCLFCFSSVPSAFPLWAIYTFCSLSTETLPFPVSSHDWLLVIIQVSAQMSPLVERPSLKASVQTLSLNTSSTTALIDTWHSKHLSVSEVLLLAYLLFFSPTGTLI